MVHARAVVIAGREVPLSSGFGDSFQIIAFLIWKRFIGTS
jgi:hypothetical protein